jgi:hypothetical protein
MGRGQGAKRGESAERRALGRVQAGCELREVQVTGDHRHHYFTAVLRDYIGNVWQCADHHVDQDEAHRCAKAEFERRVEFGQIKTTRRPADL